MDKSFIVATAGHVDHGKSSLVRALTGIDPDRLPEEKARGITIDLGFAHLRLQTSPDCEYGIELGIVDVPGHEDFVKNMVAGVGAVDLALIVVAADDGWMPQTEEHVQILEYLGVRRAVVALTKIDRVIRAESMALDAVRGALQGTAFAAAPIVPTSVVDGRGLTELRAALVRALAEAPAPVDRGKPRLWVDRAFTVRGVGTVVTGTLVGGALRVGDAVSVWPDGCASRVRSLQNHNRALEEARPGMRTAINLADVAAAGEKSSPWERSVGRGDRVAKGVQLGGSRTIDVWLTRSARDAKAGGLPHDSLVRVHVGTASAAARLVLAGEAELRAGEMAAAQLRLERALPLMSGDRFVLRDRAEKATIAGGVVLDAEGDRKRFQREAYQEYLDALRETMGDATGVICARLRRDRAMRIEEMAARGPFSQTEIAAAVAETVRSGATQVGNFVVSRDAWAAALNAARGAVAMHHRDHPAQLGIPLARLRAGPLREWVKLGLFDALVDRLVDGECEQVGAALKLRAHRPVLPDALQGAVAAIRGTLAARGLNPPARAELGGSRASAEALDFLLKTGEVVELSSEVVIAAEAFGAAGDAVRRLLAEHGRATVSEVRDRLGASRRVVVPLLERFDRERITRREGDCRVLVEETVGGEIRREPASARAPRRRSAASGP